MLTSFKVGSFKWSVRPFVGASKFVYEYDGESCTYYATRLLTEKDVRERQNGWLFASAAMALGAVSVVVTETDFVASQSVPFICLGAASVLCLLLWGLRRVMPMQERDACMCKAVPCDEVDS